MFTKLSYTKQELLDLVIAASSGNVQKTFSISEVQYSVDALTGETECIFPDSDKKYVLTDNAIKDLCRETAIPYTYYLKVGATLKGTNLKSRATLIARERIFSINEEMGIVRGIYPSAYPNLKHEDFINIIPTNDKTEITLDRTYNRLDFLSAADFAMRVIISEVELSEDKIYIGFTLKTSELGRAIMCAPVMFNKGTESYISLVSSSKPENFKFSARTVDGKVIEGLMKEIISLWKTNQFKFGEIAENLIKVKMESDEVMKIFDQLVAKKVSKGFVLKLADEFEQFPISGWFFINKMLQQVGLMRDLDKKIMVEATISEMFGFANFYE